jgi:hypothetical protein
MLEAVESITMSRRFLIPVLFLVAWATPSFADVIGEAEARQLAGESDLVMMGRCETAESGWDAAGRVIVTRARVKPQRTFKGHPVPAVTVETLGGTVGAITMGASHGASFRAGETAVLFLRRSRYGGHHVVAHGRLGKLPVRVGENGRSLIGRGAAVDVETFAGWLEGAAK